MFIINILAFIFVLGLVILLHELGHFIMAKRAGILCHEFSIGMGPIIYSKKKGETVYSIRAIPIGGFVAMAGEEVNEEMLKVGSEIKIVKDETSGLITHMVMDVDDERYPDAERIRVDYVDLSGKDGEPLMINQHVVKNDAYYVYKNKALQVAPFERSFESKSLWQRFLAIFAGPFMNFILAFFLFIIIAMVVGFPAEDNQGNITTEIGSVSENLPAYEIIEPGDKIVSVEGISVDTWQEFSDVMQDNRGIRELNLSVERNGEIHDLTLNPRVAIITIGISSDPNADDPNDVQLGPVQSNTPAREAGFETGDVIVNVDGVAVDSWGELVEIMHENEAGDLMVFEVSRDGTVHTIEVEPYSRELVESQGVQVSQTVIGVDPLRETNILRSFPAGLESLGNASTMIFDTLRMLFGGTVSVGDLAGPVGIYTLTTSAFQQGLITFFNWVALLSVNLGILNLLPIPALDGGRLVFLGYEAVTRRKVNKKIENTLHIVMFFLLIGLMLIVTYNDILRLFN